MGRHQSACIGLVVVGLFSSFILLAQQQPASPRQNDPTALRCSHQVALAATDRTAVEVSTRLTSQPRRKYNSWSEI